MSRWAEELMMVKMWLVTLVTLAVLGNFSVTFNDNSFN